PPIRARIVRARSSMDRNVPQARARAAAPPRRMSRPTIRAGATRSSFVAAPALRMLAWRAVTCACDSRAILPLLLALLTVGNQLVSPPGRGAGGERFCRERRRQLPQEGFGEAAGITGLGAQRQEDCCLLLRRQRGELAAQLPAAEGAVGRAGGQRRRQA